MLRELRHRARWCERTVPMNKHDKLTFRISHIFARGSRESTVQTLMASNRREVSDISKVIGNGSVDEVDKDRSII